MASSTRGAKIELTVTFTINEREARALELLSQYSTDTLVQWLGQHVSGDLMKVHGPGLVLFLETVRRDVRQAVRLTDEAREVFEGTKVARYPKNEKE